MRPNPKRRTVAPYAPLHRGGGRGEVLPVNSTAFTPQQRRRRPDEILASLASHALLAIFAVIVVYPVAWMVFASLKDQTDLLSNIWGIPKSWAWVNYRDAWNTAGLGRALFNSIFVSLSTVVLVVAIAAPAGYALAKFRLRFATPIFLLFVLTMQAPVPVIPLYVLLVKLHLTDSLHRLHPASCRRRAAALGLHLPGLLHHRPTRAGGGGGRRRQHPPGRVPADRHADLRLRPSRPYRSSSSWPPGTSTSSRSS